MKIRIPVIFLIGSIDIYSPLLTDVINDSLKRGIFPNEVIPLFKNADPCFKTKCRPVSLLSHISNVFERIIYNYVNEYILFLSKIQT